MFTHQEFWSHPTEQNWSEIETFINLCHSTRSFLQRNHKTWLRLQSTILVADCKTAPDQDKLWAHSKLKKYTFRHLFGHKRKLQFSTEHYKYIHRMFCLIDNLIRLKNSYPIHFHPHQYFNAWTAPTFSKLMLNKKWWLVNYSNKLLYSIS